MQNLEHVAGLNPLKAIAFLLHVLEASWVEDLRSRDLLQHNDAVLRFPCLNRWNVNFTVPAQTLDMID